MTQREKVLKALQRGQKLTPLEALNRGMGMRLGGHIYALRKAGHDIRSELVKKGDARVSKYWLHAG
jgi:hypothetical protein